tara:strand:- start:1176 stop:1622 length:447 start_codon:yes stop_codon:yes gene_type:complete
MIGFRKYWYGKECEGRLTDVETLFIADISVHEEQVVDMEKMPHIYFCSGAVEQLIEGKGTLNWEWLVKFIDRTNITISLEVTPGMLQKVPPMVTIKTHIMYMISIDEVRLLKQNDSIKVVHGPYELYCTSIQNMQKVTPDDYKYDRHE